MTHHEDFLYTLREAITKHDFTQDRIPGQAFILLPEAVPYVSCGTGKHSVNPNDYVLRCHRGRVGAYLKRELAAPAENCAVVVYTLDAYLSDPDITPDEATRVIEGPTLLSDDGICLQETFVIVTVLATAGPQSQLSPFRFVHNLAGGNKEAQVWTADEIRAKAREILEYDNDWTTVADPA